MHADQRAAVEMVREKAGRNGVEVIPAAMMHCDGGWWWYYKHNGYQARWAVLDDAAALIVTGALAKWLAGQGHGVIYSPWAEGWFHIDHHMDDADAETTEMWVTSGDCLSALIIAVLARLDELPDKEKA